MVAINLKSFHVAGAKIQFFAGIKKEFLELFLRFQFPISITQKKLRQKVIKRCDINIFATFNLNLKPKIMTTTNFFKIAFSLAIFLTACQKEEDIKPLPETDYPKVYGELTQTEWKTRFTAFEKINFPSLKPILIAIL